MQYKDETEKTVDLQLQRSILQRQIFAATVVRKVAVTTNDIWLNGYGATGEESSVDDSRVPSLLLPARELRSDTGSFVALVCTCRVVGSQWLPLVFVPRGNPGERC